MSNQNYALIIGVQDYRTYDPSGGADVPGARNDARAWYRVCLSMGFSPENIRVLTSPMLTPAALGPGAEKATLGDATRASIVEGLAWLSTRLGGDAPASGLMTFTGHGSEGERGMPLLCPADTTASLEEVIDVAALRRVSSARVRDNLTMMLDCCQAQVGASAAESMRGRIRARGAGAGVPEEARARVVAACRWDQQSVSARFLGEEMGAFTWAAASALGQWQATLEDGVARLDVSYGDVVARMRALLSALAFEQETVLSGPKGVAALAFLHPGTAGARGETGRAPTATRSGHQLDGGERAGTFVRYHIRLETSPGEFAELGDILVTASDMGERPPLIGSTPMAPGTEYWVFNSGAMTALQRYYAGSQDLEISYLGTQNVNVEVPAGSSCFTASEETSWTPVGETRWPEGAYTFSSNDGVVQGASLQCDGDTPTRWWWVQTGSKNLSPDQLSRVVLPFLQSPLSASNYYAASTFKAFAPNG